MITAADLSICLATLAPNPYALTPDEADELIGVGRDLGFGSVALFGSAHSLVNAPGDPGRTTRTFEAAGLTLALLDACMGWVNGPDAVDQNDGYLFEIAADTGASVIGAISMTADLPAGRDTAIEGMRRVADRAHELGSRVAIEFLPWSAIPDARSAWELIDAVGRPNVGFNFDTWHWLRRPGGVDLTQLDEIPVERIYALQVEDVQPTAEADLLDECMHRRVLPMPANTALVELLATLRRHGADPVVMAECFNDDLVALGPEPAAQAMRDTLLSTLRAAGW